MITYSDTYVSPHHVVQYSDLCMYASGVMASRLAGWHTHVGCEYVCMYVLTCSMYEL